MFHRILALCCCLFALASAHAELPPGSYDNLRANAEEAVVLQVTNVTIATRVSYKMVTVQAKVLQVARTRSGLTKGDTVTVKYQVATIPVSGPRPVPILRKNGIYPAFMKKAEGGYVPAAYGESFNAKPEER